MLHVNGLCCHHGGTPILRDIHLTISPGEIVALIGPNGAGKSTLLKCIARILPASAGSIRLDGKPLGTFGRRELARAIAYVPQQVGSALALQVIDMVALGRAPHRGPASRARDRDIVCTIIEALDLTSLALRPFGELSGGQRQRVLIARALAQEGRLMLMDEPTSNLDPRYQLETIATVQAIARDGGTAALVALHDLSLAARLSHRIVLLNDGRVHADGGWQDVLTPGNLRDTYGVSAIIGHEQGLPYVIPVVETAAP